MKLPKKIRAAVTALNLKLNTFYKKIIFLTLVCSILPLLVTSCISYAMAYSISKDRTIDSIRSTNKQIALNINNRLEQVESLSNSISFHLYSLYQTPLTPLSGYLKAYSQAKSSIGSVKNTFSLLQVSIFLPENCLIDTGSGNGLDFFPFSKLPNYHMTEDELFNAGSSSFWQANPNLQFPKAFSATPKNVLTCWSAYRNIHSGSLNYAFACHIRMEEFADFLQAPAGSGINSFIVGKDNRILIHSTESEIGTLFTPSGQDLLDKETNSFIEGQSLYVTQSLKKGDFLLVTQIPLSYIKENSNFVLTFFMLSSVSIIICSVLLSVSGSRTFTRRINTLSEVMEAAKRSPDREILQLLTPMVDRPDNGKDEIDRLANTFQKMILDNDAYFQQLLEMSLQTEKLKYQLLQSQISPHFLFNTLNTIISCQSLGKYELAQETISNLSQFYRQLLHDPDVLIPIREELRITELYLNLICVSKPNPITWEFITEDGTPNFLICKFVFQPFMENAVLHAMKDSSSPLHIIIRIAYGDDDALVISISDNGTGMEPQVLKDLRTTLSAHTADYSRHFGIGNVNVRLIPYFSRTDGQILADSTPGKGSCFTILLKQILEEEPDET